MTSVSMSRRAFTLLELIVVITIIAILMSVGLMVGHHVVNSGRTKATANVLQLLDNALSAYNNSGTGVGTKVPAMFTDDVGNEFPLADAIEGGQLIPSTSYVLAVLKKEPKSDAIISSLPSEYTTRVPAGSVAAAVPQQRINNTDQAMTLLNVNDSWGNPIRFVHPKYQGNYATSGTRFTIARPGNAQTALDLRRDAVSNKDADGGLCPSGRPYFYSPGPDGDPTTSNDNIYSNKPTFPPEVTSLQRG